MNRHFPIALLLAALPLSQQPFFSTPVRDPRRPLVCAHRGRIQGSELENSVAVMKYTFQRGVPMIEFDLRESKDGVVFLCHDESLERTTNGSGLLASYTADQLSHVLLRDSSGKVTSEPLNRFDDLLDWARQTNVDLLVDLKDTPPSVAIQAIRKHGLEHRVILLTFDQKTARAAVAADAEITVSILARTKREVDAALLNAHGHALALYVPQSADIALYEYARRTGSLTITDTLGKPDDEAIAKSASVYQAFLANHPVDIFVTNHALQLNESISQLHPR
jgi:glycerophosphoryl diester phosphodiesterase